MSNQFDAIVIGSGIGGGGIGALLAHAGWKVLLLERNKLLGGRCISYDRSGCVMDLGWHFYCLGKVGPLQEICNRVGMPEGIPWNNVSNMSFIQVGNTVKKYSKKSMYESVPEQDRGKFEELFNAVFTLSDEELDKLWYVPVEEWVGGFTKDLMAHTLIESFVCQYFCVPSSVASATEFIRAFRAVMSMRATAYPSGGNFSVPSVYLTAIEHFGGVVKAATPVEKILVEDGAAVGVVTENGDEYWAPVIISNADLKKTVFDFVGEQHFPSAYVDRIKQLTYSCHGVMLRVLLSEKVTEKQVVIYIPDDKSPPLKVTDEMLRGEVPKLIGGCFGSPTNFDPHLAPPGKQLITSLHGCPLDIGGKIDKWRESLMNSFYDVFPEARGKVEKVWVDPPSLIRGLAGENGCIIGIGQTVDQVHERRPSVVSPLKGLYFSSSEAGGHGIGTELAATSALELFEVLEPTKGAAKNRSATVATA
ncbi:MAG TPA: NAD(P)-binding protein [Burkholderiaceae bacterium]|nr:NAD(P)-binding protein [Burkholderiaceae bacterium]